MKNIIGLIGFFVVLLINGPSNACSYSVPIFWSDKPIQINADGSFSQAEEYRYERIYGDAPQDIGGGKIWQRIIDAGACSGSESLLVVDCIFLETIVINGLVDPDKPFINGGGPEADIAMLYPPRGKIRLSQSVTIAELAAISVAEGYEYETDPKKAFAVKRQRNAYNPFTGCKVLYPESLGAKQ
jgi:hypothetical protein